MSRQPSIVEISDIVSRYGTKKVSIRGLAREYGVGRTVMTRWLTEAQVAVHPRGYTPEAAKEIIRRYQREDASIRELAAAFGGSYSGIRNLLLDNHVRLRGPGSNEARKRTDRAARSMQTPRPPDIGVPVARI